MPVYVGGYPKHVYINEGRFRHTLSSIYKEAVFGHAYILNPKTDTRLSANRHGRICYRETVSIQIVLENLLRLFSYTF